MATLELFWMPGTCARVALVALEEIGEPFEVHVLDKFSGEHLRPDYQAINPKGKVPALVVDGKVITENPAIQTFLARSYPDARLLPAHDPDIEIEALSMMSWFAAGVHPSITRLRFPALANDDPRSHERIRELASAQLQEVFAILEDRVAASPWLFGEWSIVDVYMLWLWFRAYGSGMPGDAFPRCADHADRCERRPSVARALDREERMLAVFESRGVLPASLPAHQAGRAPSWPGEPPKLR